MNFPSNPTSGQEYTVGNRTWHYNGKGWQLIGGAAAEVEYDDIVGKPTLSAVATSGSYSDLSNKPTIPAIPGVATPSVNGLMAAADKAKLNEIAASATANATDAQLRDRSTHTGTQGASSITGLATVATSGAYGDLSGKPTIPTLPALAAVATSGSYNDLSSRPTIPAAQVNADWNASSGAAQILNKPTLATVAASGSYNDLSNKPTIPAAQVSVNWTATSGVTQILNKPSLAVVATSGAYGDLSGKPTIPTIPGVATTGSNGLMASTDKVKLNAVGTMANRDATISTGDPSGGANGDIWFKV